MKALTFAVSLLLAVSVALPAESAAGAPDPRAPNGAAAADWLRRTSIVDDQGSSAQKGFGPLIAVVVVAGLGAGALVLRRRRRGRLPAPAALGLEVLSSVRVGPRGHAVVASVGGRLLLLGVTDHSIRRLAWLDSKRDERPSVVPMFDDDRPSPRLGPQASAVARYAAPPIAEPRRFRDILLSALGRRADIGDSASAALQIAAETEDVVTSLARRRPSVKPAIEGQAAGLAARLQGR